MLVVHLGQAAGGIGKNLEQMQIHVQVRLR